MTTPGAKFISKNTTVGQTQSTVLADSTVGGGRATKLLIQNSHASANIFLGLAGESNLSTSSRNGWWLAPGASIVLDEPPNNAITAISDTSGAELSIYITP